MAKFVVYCVRDDGCEYWAQDCETGEEADQAAEDHERFTGFKYIVIEEEN